MLRVRNHARRCEGWTVDQRVLELGCGLARKREGSIGLDRNPRARPDVLWDLDHFPYPFEDSSFDEVLCYHILEHVGDFIGCVEEIHRILRPSGMLRVESPYFTSVGAFADPTHRRFLTSGVFDYFIEGTPGAGYGYTEARFRLVSRRVTFMKDRWIPRFVQRWLNAHIGLYERHWAFILPGNLVSFELETLKG